MRPRYFQQNGRTNLWILGFIVVALIVAVQILQKGNNLPKDAVLQEVSSLQTGGEIDIRTLSTRPNMISGGDVLVEISLPKGVGVDGLLISVNQQNVSGNFQGSPDGSAVVGLISDLEVGASVIRASVGEQFSELAIENHPLQGPVFSGPHQTPMICETEAFGLGVAGGDCVVPTRVQYHYRTTTGEFKPYEAGQSKPDDLATTTTLDGYIVDYIVRLETGVINRAIYEIAFLHEPGTPLPAVWTETKGWNNRLIYHFGGGCAPGYHQGRRTAGIMENIFLASGYAVASSTFNVFGINCNDVTSAETMMMVKEHFIETYGLPEYTLGWGTSGGAMQQHLIANNYPGLLDGIMPGRGFPDIYSMIPPVADCSLIKRATETGTQSWTDKQKGAVAGYSSWANCYVPPYKQENYAWINIGYSPGWVGGPLPPEIRPSCDPVITAELIYDPETNPTGVRCSIYDNGINSIGVNPATGFAHRPLDNVGVQYGLAAFNNADISAEQFVELNELIGGYDNDGRLISNRSSADPEAVNFAYTAGRVNSGGGGLSEIPIIDLRAYLEPKPDVHDYIRSFAMRARLESANGYSENQVIIVYDPEVPGGGDQVEAELLQQMDTWLMAINADTAPGSKGERIVRNRPELLSDGCYTREGRRIHETASMTEGECAKLFPIHGDPRIAAGAPISGDVIKCQLKPLNENDYVNPLTDAQIQRLNTVFPDGVCDYSRPGIGQQLTVQVWRDYSRR